MARKYINQLSLATTKSNSIATFLIRTTNKNNFNSSDNWNCVTWNGFHLWTIKVPIVYIIGQLECVTYQCYFINTLFDIFFLKGVPHGTF